MKTKIFLTILCVCFSINLHSQEGEIIYTDFEPDSIITPLCVNHSIEINSTYNNQTPFDINYDDVYDISFGYGTSSSESIYIIAGYDIIIGEPIYWFMKTSMPNDTISNLQFNGGDWYAHLRTYQKTYVAIKHDLGDGNYCYAWICYYFDKKSFEGGTNTVTIYDMAYCTVPNYPLRVGQKCFDDTLINETSEFKDYVLFPSPANDKITLKFNNHYYYILDNEIKIYSIDGRLLKTQNSDFENIDLSNLSSGVYIMKIYLGNGESFRQKFVKE